ncbi:related to COQ2-para-hydroxybenzoate--polyprenyltransferase [Rhynchosporium secalis]|uniref:Calcium uniporter protein, mitochondrial n=1 Tax=Rhynchosporium secalis TaxID=38038 RepID=A0A1E1MAD9_RHYSE|nr:related to COQ2-para-hydroxybenzoate--polyprenyltransferase [Rhynchosporium secalis]
MRPQISPTAVSTSASRYLQIRFQPQITHTFRSRPRQFLRASHSGFCFRAFSTSIPTREDEATSKAKALNQKGLDEEVDGFHKQIDNAIGQAKELQAKTPWHREGSDKPPVVRNRSAGAMTKGKLLTTPSRLLKLILPLTTEDHNSDRKDIEPLALLVHPQQPLSYLERLIQSELPMIKGKDGKEKVAQVHFRAEDSAKGEIKVDKRDEDDIDEEGEEREQGSDEQMIDGKLVKVGKISPDKEQEKENAENLSKSHKIEHELRGGPGEGGVESYSGQGREGKNDGERKFVRWSSSTEIGDFIRDAARGKEFAVEIEGASSEIRVGVPSFNDRTHYLRVRLRKTSRKLADMASIKKECDRLAHKSAQRLAMGGFGILVGWWGAIYHFTFRTDYGWDTMEPVTYLAGLSTIILGYLWFLYHNREVSYRAALNLTVSRRQNTLYTARGFDVGKWEAMIEEANALRKEIKNVADEYDVEWDEKADEGSEEVHDALKEERRKNRDDDDDDGDDGDAKTKKAKEKSKKKNSSDD